MKKIYTLATFAAFVAMGCNKDTTTETSVPAEEFELGGATTLHISGADAYSYAAPNLSAANAQRHLDADAAFAQFFVTAPAPRFGGLGPVYNQSSCNGCHIRNGRSQPPTSINDNTSGLLFRLSLAGTGAHGGNVPVPNFGGQLQHRAIYGTQPEGQVDIQYISEVVNFIDGYTATLQRPVYTIINTYTTLPTGVLVSPRNAPPVYGLGLIEAITEADILANVDENDANADGISGRANYVWSVRDQQLKLGRFGWKANNPTAYQQTAEAFNQDMGITSPYFPNENCHNQSNCTNDTTTATTSIDDAFVKLTAFYFQTLAVPAARNLNDATVKRGKELFEKAYCAKCHTPKFVTGTHEFAELSNQTIYPYSDWLVHDMGQGLADNRPDNQATGTEWRTAPLWGIGLTQVVNPNARFLHDGRARTLEEAILWHDGEASYSRDYYKNLSKKDRDAVIAFLKAL